MAAIELITCEDGRTRLRADFCASALPAVLASELQGAWETAQRAAGRGPVHMPDDPDGVIFSGTDGSEVCLDFDDYDAYCWALAIDKVHSLHSITGLALCFRMFALYQLLEANAWARSLFSLDRRTGLQIDKNLLMAAANVPLTDAGLFNATQMRLEAEVTALPSPGLGESIPAS